MVTGPISSSPASVPATKSLIKGKSTERRRSPNRSSAHGAVPQARLRHRQLGAVDPDVTRGRPCPYRDVPLARLRWRRGLECNPDVTGDRVEIKPGGQVIGNTDSQRAGGRPQIDRSVSRGNADVARSGIGLQVRAFQRLHHDIPRTRFRSDRAMRLADRYIA